MIEAGRTDRLTASAAARGAPQLADFWDWWRGLARHEVFSVQEIPFDALERWRFDPDRGTLAHDSGGFFTVEGLRVTRPDGAVADQPIINQPEIGILGILVKEFDGVLHCLMQAKFEPGNLNVRQLSPTVQATRSNYTRLHQGRTTPYVEYFRDPPPQRLLVDTLQSEQGSWFWCKRNRNMVVETTAEVPLREGFRWLTVGEVLSLLRSDNVVNMDARTVLACMPLLPGPRPDGGGDDYTRALLRSYRAHDADTGAVNAPERIISWFTEAKVRCTWQRTLVPLAGLPGWRRTDTEIVDEAGQAFRIVAARIRAANREVTQWTQPLLAPHRPGLAVFLTRVFDGVLHVLASARAEPGLLDRVEIGPTVQWKTAAEQEEADAALARLATAEDRARVRGEALLSEEGGRFRHAQTRYRIVDAAQALGPCPPDGYCWLTVAQLGALVRHGHYLTIEARTLLACLHALW